MIVADKPQTTPRTGIQGRSHGSGRSDSFPRYARNPCKAHSRLNRRMMDSVREALHERDLLIYVADSKAALFAETDRQALDLIRKSDTPVFLGPEQDRSTEGKGAAPTLA